MRSVRSMLLSRDLFYSSISHSPIPKTVSRGHVPLNFHIQHMKLAIQSHTSNLPAKFMIQMKGFQNMTTSGRKLYAGSLLGILGVAGAMHLSPSVVYAMNGNIEGHLQDLEDPSDFLKEDLETVWGLTKKFQLPAVLLLTVIFGWQHPVVLAVNVRRRAMLQNPGLSKTRLFYARKVEVQDYKLLCFARVELRNARLSLIGILGSWWILSSSNY